MKKIKTIVLLMIISSAAICQNITVANNAVCITGPGTVILTGNNAGSFSAKVSTGTSDHTISFLKKENEALKAQLKTFKKKEVKHVVTRMKKAAPKQKFK